MAFDEVTTAHASEAQWSAAGADFAFCKSDDARGSEAHSHILCFLPAFVLFVQMTKKPFEFLILIWVSDSAFQGVTRGLLHGSVS